MTVPLRLTTDFPQHLRLHAELFHLNSTSAIKSARSLKVTLTAKVRRMSDPETSSSDDAMNKNHPTGDGVTIPLERSPVLANPSRLSQRPACEKVLEAGLSRSGAG